MDRRNFLSTLTAFAGALTLDPDKLLWRQGEKTIFVPPAPVVVNPGIFEGCLIPNLATELRMGDMVTFGGVNAKYAVNPITRKVIEVEGRKFLQYFLVTGIEDGRYIFSPSPEHYGH